jgi:hypothetical protein
MGEKMDDEFGLLASIEHGFDDNQEMEIEEISVEPETVEAISGESEIPVA